MASLKSSVAVLAVAGIVLAGCSNPDGSENNTGTGAIVGGVLGAIVGASLPGDDKKGAVLGGIAGAALGAGAGNILDRQQAALARDIRGSGAQIINTGDQLIVRMPEGITFATESATVRSGIRDDILAIARNLQEFPNNSVQVIGHTDNTGSSSFNQDLSQRRANAVASLLRQGGVPSGRLRVFGQGETQPIASNGSAGGRSQNRRVEIIITPR